MTLDTSTHGHAAASPLADKNLKECDPLIEATAKVGAHLQDEFDDKLAIVKSKHQSDIGELQSRHQK
jgi:hypothetical protein